MTPIAKALLIFLSVALVVFVWMFRYEISGAGGPVRVFVLDRWTGTVKVQFPPKQD